MTSSPIALISLSSRSLSTRTVSLSVGRRVFDVSVAVGGDGLAYGVAGGTVAGGTAATEADATVLVGVDGSGILAGGTSDAAGSTIPFSHTFRSAANRPGIAGSGGRGTRATAQSRAAMTCRFMMSTLANTS